MLYCYMLCYVILRNVVQWYAMRCYVIVMLCYVALCCEMLCSVTVMVCVVMLSQCYGRWWYAMMVPQIKCLNYDYKCEIKVINYLQREH